MISKFIKFITKYFRLTKSKLTELRQSASVMVLLSQPGKRQIGDFTQLEIYARKKEFVPRVFTNLNPSKRRMNG